jgi:hypothetical protein
MTPNQKIIFALAAGAGVLALIRLARIYTDRF